MAHIDAGKTTTTERILFYTGKRTASERSTKALRPWTGWSRSRSAASPLPPPPPLVPGAIFASTLSIPPATSTSPPKSSGLLRVLDGAVAVFDAVHGVQPQSEKVWRQADKYGVPRICFINKIDKMGADFEHAVDTIRKRLNAKPIAIQIPIGQEAKFKGVIDLIEMKSITWADDTIGAEYITGAIPPELQKKAEAFHTQLVETVAENDDEILHKFLEGGEYFRRRTARISAKIDD